MYPFGVWGMLGNEHHCTAAPLVHRIFVFAVLRQGTQGFAANALANEWLCAEPVIVLYIQKQWSRERSQKAVLAIPRSLHYIATRGCAVPLLLFPLAPVDFLT